MQQQWNAVITLPIRILLTVRGIHGRIGSHDRTLREEANLGRIRGEHVDMMQICKYIRNIDLLEENELCITNIGVREEQIGLRTLLQQTESVDNDNNLETKCFIRRVSL